MFWVLITILSYFLLAITALGDKYLLVGPPEPKSYTFFINVPGILLLILVPFVGFVVPDSKQILFSLLAGGLAVFAGYFLYVALEKFEASRVIPAVGGILPLCTIAIVYFSSGGKAGFDSKELLAFLVLVLGSVLISLERGKAFSLSGLFLPVLVALLFALSFVVMKNLYLQLPFWTTLILTRVGAFFVSLVFLLSRGARAEIFRKSTILQKQTGSVFLANQGVGAVALLLQNWAIALAPLNHLAFINALEGVRYVFLLVLSVLISIIFPGALKEKISKNIISQKAVAILFIVVGLVILAVSVKQ